MIVFETGGLGKSFWFNPVEANLTPKPKDKGTSDELSIVCNRVEKSMFWGLGVRFRFW